MDPRILPTLKEVSLFQEFREREEALHLIAGAMTTRKFKTGAHIIREGERGDEMYVLMQGVVEISKTTLQQEQYTVARLSDSNHPFFGELALIDDDTRSASITAASECEVLVMSRRRFTVLCNAHPDIGMIIYRKLTLELGQRLRSTNADVIMLFEALVKEVQGKVMK